MALKIFPTSQKERALLFIRTLLNNTNAISKVSDNSILEGLAQGISKIAGKAEKDVMLAMSQLYPDNSYGAQLDVCSELFGISKRFGSSGSSTYLRLVANIGTTYLASTHLFTSKDGIQFQLENNITIGNFGFEYVKVRSIDVGTKTNVDPGRIDSVSPLPSGHNYVINEYIATGGRDAENDDTFRERIKQGSNVLATHTLGMLEQVFMKINNNVLKLFYQGKTSDGKLRIAIVTQNGVDLSSAELDAILSVGEKFFGLTQLRPFGQQSYGIFLKNIEWQTIDITFRVQLLANTNVDNWRKDAQIKISKLLDFRTFNSAEQKVEWDELLRIIKTTPGTKYVPDNYFIPNADQAVNKNKLPRLRGFIAQNLDGALLTGISGQFSPAAYPVDLNKAFNTTVLKSI